MSSNTFSCPICCFKYDRANNLPKVLPCGHTLCLACLKDLIGRNQLCPFDRKKIRNGSTTPDEFPTNLILSQLIKEPEPSNISLCNIHSKKQAFICLKENTLICKYCNLMGEHRDHNVLHVGDLKQALERKKEQLGEYQKKVEESRRKTILEHNKARVKQLTQTCFRFVRDLLAQKEEEVLEKFEKFCKLEEKKIEQRSVDEIEVLNEIEKQMQILNIENISHMPMVVLETMKRDIKMLDEIGKEHIEEYTKSLEGLMGQIEDNWRSFSETLVTAIGSFKLFNGLGLGEVQEKIEIPAPVVVHHQEEIKKQEEIPLPFPPQFQFPVQQEEKKQKKQARVQNNDQYLVPFNGRMIPFDPRLPFDLQFSQSELREMKVQQRLRKKQYQKQAQEEEEEKREIENRVLVQQNEENKRINLQMSKQYDEDMTFVQSIFEGVFHDEEKRLILSPTQDKLQNNLRSEVESWKGIETLVVDFSKYPPSKHFAKACGLLLEHAGERVTDLRLKLSNKKLKDEDFLSLCSQNFWKDRKLMFIDLEIQGVTATGNMVPLIKGIMSLNGLKGVSLDFSQSTVKDEVIDSLVKSFAAQMHVLLTLKLDFSHTMVTDRGFQKLCEIFTCSSWSDLRTLSLSFAKSRIEETSIEHFMKQILPRLTRLENICLGFNGAVVTDGNISWMADVLKLIAAHIKQLQLDFSGTKVTDAGLEFLASELFSRLVQTQTFHLSVANTYVGDESLQRVFLALRDTSKEIVDLKFDVTGTRVSDEAMKVLWEENFPRFEKLRSLVLGMAKSAVTSFAVESICERVERSRYLMENLQKFELIVNSNMGKTQKRVDAIKKTIKKNK